MNPQDRNLAEAEEIVKEASRNGGVNPEYEIELTQDITQALAKTRQDGKIEGAKLLLADMCGQYNSIKNKDDMGMVIDKTDDILNKRVEDKDNLINRLKYPTKE